MLTEIKLENYRRFERETIVPLYPMTFLFGPNGSGKSAVLDALNQMSTIVTERSRTYEEQFPTHGAYSLRNQKYDKNKPLKLGLSYRFGEGFSAANLEYRLVLDEIDNQIQGEETLTIDGRTVISETSTRSVLSSSSYEHPDDTFAVEGLLDHIRKMRRYRISPTEAKSKTAVDAKFITVTGKYLAAALDNLFAVPGQRQAFVAEVQQMFPAISDISTRGPATGVAIQYKAESDQTHTGAHLSDGQAVVLALTFLLHSPDSPSVLLLDELENGLSPLLIRETLNALLRRIESSGPVKQVVCTTHSPFVIAWADAHGSALQVSASGQIRSVSEVLQQFGVLLEGPVSYSEACGLLETYWHS